jgi:hypothetical protein
LVAMRPTMNRCVPFGVSITGNRYAESLCS